MPKQRSLAVRLAEKEEDIRQLKLKSKIEELKDQLPKRKKRKR